MIFRKSGPGSRTEHLVPSDNIMVLV